MPSSLHSWEVTPREAVEIQRNLRPRLILDSNPRSIDTIAGIDVSYEAAAGRLIAGVVVFRMSDLSPIESVTAVLPATFPYIPGLLSFRETPAVLLAWKKLKRRPDCLICDGQGIAHPRRFGLASHLGLWLDIPSIGCAKSILVGTYREPGERRGSRVPLIDKGEKVGVILRTRDGVKPVYVSPGHRITLDRAVEVVLACAPRYRLPDPIRQAHHLVNTLRASRSLSIGKG
ncbi:MAG TPA: deoxyribonuclease V [Nitrospiria bacterium]|nr:deoxyribonuclease V [Nitrospiria bacterium]